MSDGLRAETGRLMKFNKLLYQKSVLRFGSYILWFVIFLFVWLSPFAKQEIKTIVICFLAMNMFLILYMSVLGGKIKEESKFNMIPITTFFPVTRKAWVISKILFVAKYLGIMIGMLLVQYLLMSELTNFGTLIEMIAGVVGTFLAVSVVVGGVCLVREK